MVGVVEIRGKCGRNKVRYIPSKSSYEVVCYIGHDMMAESQLLYSLRGPRVALLLMSESTEWQPDQKTLHRYTHASSTHLLSHAPSQLVILSKQQRGWREDPPPA